MGKASSIQFGDVQVQAFLKLKGCLIQSPVLKVYDPDLPVRVQSDASKLVVCAILEQQYGNNQHPIEYFSKQLNSAES